MAQPPRTPTDPIIQSFITRLRNLRQAGKQPGGIYGLMQPDMDAVRAREEQLRGYLGATDYGKRLEEAQNMARLQAGLALAQRGFAAAGATPRKGESPFATVSRELLSPVAGDVGAVATNLMQQRAALDAAKAAEGRQLRATALQQVTSEDAERRKLALDLAAKAAKDGKFKDNLVVVNTETNKPVLDNDEKFIQVSLRNNRLYRLGSQDVFTQPKNTKLVPFSQLDKASASVTDADKKIEADRNLLFTSMNRIQSQQLQGPNTPYSATSALYFDLPAYQRGEFAFRYIPPGTNTLEAAAKSIPITNKRLQQYITKKVNSAADATLKADFGSENQEIKEARVQKAVRSILNETPQMLFGAQNIPDIGVNESGETIGYIPTAAAFNPALQTEAVKMAVRTLKEDAAANPEITYSPVAFPQSQEALNKTPGRIKVAINLFPDVFGDPEPAGTEAFDPNVVQRRRDIEAALANSTLRIGASNDDYRRVISEEARKIADKRNVQQSKKAASDARDEFRTRLEFRRSLLDFKNAAIQAGNVEGIVTGRIAAAASRIGLDEFIAGDGAEAWRRLTAASDKLQRGQSRRVGKEFGDTRISNYDAADYKGLLADITKAGRFNRTLIENGLRLVNRELEGFMRLGGQVDWTEGELRQAAEAGVDFSNLETKENWHGHGYYGKSRFFSTRQKVPSLSQSQINAVRTQGQLKDTMFGNKYIVPDVNYGTDELPTYQRARAATDDEPAIPETRVLVKGPLQLEQYMESLAQRYGVSKDVIRERIVRSIISFNQFRDTSR